ncbi:T9SS type A sorting domain-containing protein [Flavobacterium rhizosphaerae]|uniref:T9SS type A sorting domain-containing protein n=1 Tax=Flavobacterium rhizosphaerae TaxID=3163298 RepID=A0ABW8YYC5_9FLAO
MKKITYYFKFYVTIFIILFTTGAVKAQCPDNITVDNDEGECGAIIEYTIEGAGSSASANGVVNPSGANSFTGWNVTNGGSGWGVTGDPAFITSYATCSMNQIIDLTTMGISDEYMDTQPAITVSDEYSGSGNNFSDTYFLTVELRGESNNVIATYTTGNITTTTNWQTASHTFTAYGTGVRKVYISHGGKDAEFWAGQYGSKMKNATLTVNLPTSTFVQTAGIESGEMFPIGTTTNTFEITDEDNNVTTCSFDVTVVDAEAPVVTLQDITVVLDDTGNATIAFDDIDNGSYENCASPVIEMDVTAFTCENLGENTVTVSMSDGTTTTTETAIVTVVDDISPVIAAQDVTLSLDENGEALLTPEDANNGSTDNCSITDYIFSQGIFDASDIGENTVTFTVYDAAGNSSETTITVTVADDMAPTVITQDITVALNPITIVTISAMDIDNSSTDNTGISSYSVSPEVFTCEDIGVNTVTLTITDNYGNVSTGTAIVTVTDPENYCNLAATDTNFAKELTVYPNPSNGLFTITAGNNVIDRIDTYDISGRLVKTIEPSKNNEVSLDLTEFNSGMYILRIVSNNKVQTYKINKL